MSDSGEESKSPFSIDIRIGKEIDRSVADILKALLQPVANEAGRLLGDTIGIAADRIRMKREYNAKLGLEQVRAKLDASGVEIKDITPPKEEELHLLMNGMSLADDDYVRNLWAGLFAEALDPQSRTTVERSFISVLESLAPTDAKIFDLLAFILRTEADLAKQLQASGIRDFSKITPEEQAAMQEVAAFNHQLRKKAIETIESRIAEYGLNTLTDSNWPENLLRQGVIERPPLRVATPSMPYLHGLDERGLSQLLDHFAKRFEHMDLSAKHNASMPTTLMGTYRMRDQIDLQVQLTSFGKRLAKACGLLDHS